MKQKQSSPSILQDLGAVAGLYRNVVWMLGQQLKHGSDWQQHVYEESIRIHTPEESRERELTGNRRN